MSSPTPFHQLEAPTPLPDGQIHRAQGVGEGAGEIGVLVWNWHDVLALGLEAVRATSNELLFNGPQVLGAKRHG